MPEASANDKWYRPYIIGAGAVGLGIATYVFFPAALPIIKAKALLAGKGAMAGGLKVVKLAGTATKFMVVVKAGMAVGRLIIEVTQDVVLIFRNLLGREPREVDYAEMIMRTIGNAIDAGLMVYGADWVCHLSQTTAGALGTAALVILLFNSGSPPSREGFQVGMADRYHPPPPPPPEPYGHQVNDWCYVNVNGNLERGYIRMEYQVDDLMDHGDQADFLFNEHRWEEL